MVRCAVDSLEDSMRKGLKRLTLNKETLRNLDPRLLNAVGGYPVSTASDCNACGSYDCTGGCTFTCDSSCCPWASGCTSC
jgi:hypothetical protein